MTDNVACLHSAGRIPAEETAQKNPQSTIIDVMLQKRFKQRRHTCIQLNQSMIWRGSSFSIQIGKSKWVFFRRKRTHDLPIAIMEETHLPQGCWAPENQNHKNHPPLSSRNLIVICHSGDFRDYNQTATKISLQKSDSWKTPPRSRQHTSLALPRALPLAVTAVVPWPHYLRSKWKTPIVMNTMIVRFLKKQLIKLCDDYDGANFRCLWFGIATFRPRGILYFLGPLGPEIKQTGN